MNYCAIGPLVAKEILKEHSHHMALAQYLYDREYFDFFKELLHTNKFVVLDNGAYEGSQLSERELLHWTKMLKPSAVVCPDRPHDLVETARKSASFADKLWKDAPSKLWKVLHAAPEGSEHFVASYIADARLYDGVCFSRLTESYSKVNPTRPAFIKHLIDRGLWQNACHHHALGMKDGNWGELNDLRELNVISTIDSSFPLWRNAGYRGDFDPFTSDVRDLAGRLKDAQAQCSR